MSTTLNPIDTNAPADIADPSTAKSNKTGQKTKPAGAELRLAERFGITEQNLAARREFIGFEPSDQALMTEFIAWAKGASAAIAKELFDRHFEFPPTRAIFERRAKLRSKPIAEVREGLEKAQAAQFEANFTGALTNWNLEYFEARLVTAADQARVYFPLKWTLGIYPDLLRISRVHLRKAGIPEARAAEVIACLDRVFNLDIQAASDTYLLNTLELCGLDMDAIMGRAGSDRTEHLDQVQLAVSVLIKQADALANDRLRDTVMERQVQVAGKLGDAFNRAHARFVKLADQADLLARGDLRHPLVVSLEKVDSTEVLGRAMRGLYESLKQVTELAREIGAGKLPSELEQRSDEDELVTAFNRMVATIRKLISDLNHMTAEHNAGDIDVRIPSDQFQGAFQQVAQGINEMVESHIATNKMAMDCVADFGRGNFEADLPSLPGKRYFINDTVEGVRVNLKLLIADTTHLAKAVASKNLRARVDINRHQGDYQKIIEAINTTIESVIQPLRSTAESASTLSSSAQQLTGTSRQMVSGAEDTAREAFVVSQSSSQISQSVTNMAASSEEMLASIREISRSANEAARVAKSAVTVTTTTNKTITQLGESSLEIGKVVKVITSIAQQTNLLALNATIEAARAGEAGKGFAVVANEVKELAKETARATEEISRKIETIQNDTKSAVHAIAEVSTIIGTINDISNSIASAVEEQTATTNEIGRNVHEAARGTADISKNITSVAKVATQTAEGAKEAQIAAQALTDLSARMKEIVAGYEF